MLEQRELANSRRGDVTVSATKIERYFAASRAGQPLRSARDYPQVYRNSTRHMRRPSFPHSRWSVLVCAMYLELCGGSVYITNLYLGSLRPLFFTSSDGEALMEYLVFASNLGNWIPLAGFIYDSKHGGPRRVIYLGAALTLVGYGGLYLCSAYRLGASFWQLWILWFLWGHGSGYFDCAAISTVTANFGESRGKVVGASHSTRPIACSAFLDTDFSTLTLLCTS